MKAWPASPSRHRKESKLQILPRIFDQRSDWNFNCSVITKKIGFRSESTSKLQETLRTEIEDVLECGKKGPTFNKKGMNMQKEDYFESLRRNVNADWNRDLHSAPCVDPLLSTDFGTKLAISRHISSSRFQYALLGEAISRLFSSLLCRSHFLFIFLSEWVFSHPI